jgi:hypothetical protein
MLAIPARSEFIERGRDQRSAEPFALTADPTLIAPE